ncbi:hypothetical protein [Chitinophaga nivalis]|uniref:Uncharacterized protein n=1 Tax=Chitinophaga nivalis TaxID=2991709 RepID=A0ABT3IRY3_9BACT|nr:hypothetical protein [Chitinophaga nivalis]MCW3463836.1 hypothetical protein [Chitinophaga nivalis]MCW3486474.1 hypothetical protein [Chitinophaga nivalis]
MNDHYGIGGTEVRPDASEAMADISQNRTLFAEKLTPQAPVKPVVVEGLTSVEGVFQHYSPTVQVDFQDAAGQTVVETLAFHHLGDFGVKGMTAQSDFLRDLSAEKEQYLKIMQQLQTNKILQAALADPAARKAMLATIQCLLQELQPR